MTAGDTNRLVRADTLFIVADLALRIMNKNLWKEDAEFVFTPIQVHTELLTEQADLIARREILCRSCNLSVIFGQEVERHSSRLYPRSFEDACEPGSS